MIATTIPPGVSPYVQRSVTGRDLISIQDFLPEELACALELAAAMKARPSDYRGTLVGKQIVLFFEKPSLRTRLTFEAGINSLGGVSFFVDQTQSRLGARESLSDVAHNLERWVDGVVLRTFAHETVTDHGAARVDSGDQRAERSGASLPGDGRHADLAGALRRPAQRASRLCRRRQQHGPFADARCCQPGATISVATPKGYEPSAEITERGPANWPPCRAAASKWFTIRSRP